MCWATRQPPGTWHIPELHLAALAADPRAVPIGDGALVAPGISAVATPGHTPGHTAYVVRNERGGDAIFAGESVKNLAELVTGVADMTLDQEQSRASIARVRSLFEEGAGNVMYCGHDAPLIRAGGPIRRERPLRAGIVARVDERSPGGLTHHDLAGP